MKYISYFILYFTLTTFSSCKNNTKDIAEIVPEYKLFKTFSEKIKHQTGLVLWSYGIDHLRKDDSQFKGGAHIFEVNYALYGKREDEISIDRARNLIVFLAQNLLEKINNDPLVRPCLKHYPYTSDLLRISIHFIDEKKIDLGQGVSLAYFSRGKIIYDGYEITEYTNRYPAIGKTFQIHEETYAEALDIVNKQLRH